MRSFICLIFFASFAYAENTQTEFSPVYGYIKNIGIPAAERIRIAEQNADSRIVGGVPATLGQYPFQAGILGQVQGLAGYAVCGASLVSSNRLVTAAHCWNDGVHQSWLFTVVLGTVRLFEGGTRIQTSAVISHPNWFPQLARNDVAVIYLPTFVTFSNAISPVSLPSGIELFESFAGERAIATGFGLTSDGGSITTNSFLSQVSLNVITNSACSVTFPLVVQASNICTSGLGGMGTCSGDSGGPLVVTRSNRPVLIGITSFGSLLGCESALPAVYARVTAFIDFINLHV